MREPSHAYEWGMSHVWVSHVTHLKKHSWHAYEWAMSMSHLTYDCVKEMSHVIHMNETWAWVSDKWVTAHNRISHDTRWITHCQTYESSMSHVCMSPVKHVDERFFHTHWNHDLHLCVEYVWRDSFTCVTWPLHMCDMTPSHVQHDSFACATWLIFYVRQDSFTSVTWLSHKTRFNFRCGQIKFAEERSLEPSFSLHGGWEHLISVCLFR